MEEFMKEVIRDHFDLYFEVCIVPYIRRYGKTLFPDLEKNLCFEHYNLLHKTTLSKNEIEPNTEQCWFCKQIKDNANNKNL
ncbi:MAG: hypothetical protein IJA43_09110 [Clostridia bacterium]|nr:hypothetical protein [Clostridia bacterium]